MFLTHFSQRKRARLQFSTIDNLPHRALVFLFNGLRLGGSVTG